MFCWLNSVSGNKLSSNNHIFATIVARENYWALKLITRLIHT